MADTVLMPKLGFDMAEGTLVRWVIAEGEKVTKGAVLAEIETDKATVEVESAFDGVVLRHLVQQGEVVPVNTPIALIGQPGEKVTEVPPKSAPMATPATVAEPAAPAGGVALVGDSSGGVKGEEAFPGGRRASPLARRIAAEKGVDLKLVSGSGPAGRVTRKDVEAFLAASALPTSAPPLPVLPMPASASVGFEQRLPLSRLRAIIARRMVEATQQVPHFFVTHEYDMAKVMELRQQINLLLPDEEKISVNDFILRAVALSLRQFPNLNASLDLQKEEIVRHSQINVGVAVALDSGLLTVVCRNTDQKPLRQISAEVREMVNRARSGKVKPEDIEGSTFSVSNLGMFDVEQFTAIINPPEAAILAVGSVRQVPVVVDGEIRPGLRMKATLSVDHRISDGAEAAKFLQSLASLLETPLHLLI